MFKNLTIKMKLVFSFILIAALVTILSGYSIYGLGQSSDGFTKYREMAKDSILASRVQSNMLMVRMNVKDYIKNPIQKEIDEFNYYYKRTMDFVDETLLEIRKSKRAPTVKTIYHQLEEYKTNFLKVIKYMDNRNKVVNDNLDINGKKVEQLLSSVMFSAQEDKDMEASLAAAKSIRALLLARLYTAKYLASNNIIHAKRVDKEFNDLQLDLEALRRSIQNPTRKKQLREAVNLIDIYKEGVRDIVTIIKNRNNIIDNKLNKIGPNIAKLAEDVKLSIKKDQDRIGPEVVQINNNLNNTSMVISTIIILLVLLLSILIPKGILSQITVFQNGLLDFFKYLNKESNKTTILDDSTNDEFGQMSKLINNNIKQIQTGLNKDNAAIDEFINKVSLISDGDLTVVLEKIPNDESLKNVQNIINDMIDSLMVNIGDNLNNILSSLSSYSSLNFEYINSSPEGTISNEISNLAHIIKDSLESTKRQNWIKDSLVSLSSTLQNEESAANIAQKAISEISRTIDAGMGALYIWNKDEQKLKLNSTYSYQNRNDLSNEFKLGEGVVGQVALEMKPIRITNVKLNEMVITTATTQETPINTYTYPLIYKGELLGVIELASYELIDDIKQEYLNGSIDSLSAIIFASIQSDATQTLLNQTQQQNEELEQQRLAMTEQNQELESTAKELESQKEELEVTQKEVEKRAAELEDSNKYKSEFLANMSHELRTPLNSINILSKLIENNKDGNLNSKQIEQATTIHQSGVDLLQLINDILDLSKIEAKMMSLNLGDVHIEALLSDLHSIFEPIANEKGVKFNLEIDKDLDKLIYTDKEKIRQIIKNFLSNALKFTDENGTITMKASINTDENKDDLPVKLSIIDTGIGIPSDKLDHIFHAFKQVDGSTSRKYGGTGLGLSISKELTSILDGKIVVQSVEGEGSTFSLLLPLELNTNHLDKDLVDIIEEKNIPSGRNDFVKRKQVADDDRNNLKDNDKFILIIEDDDKFASIVKDEANSIGLKALIALNGDDGIEMAKKYIPSGIILDMNLPVMDGWDVLKILKDNVHTRHIPVKIISADEPNIATQRMGAVEYIQKPVELDILDNALKTLIAKGDKDQKDLLIVEDDDVLRESFAELLGSKDADVNVVAVENGTKAVEAVKKIEFDCAIIDMGLPDMSGFKLLEIVKKHDCNLPIIVYTGREFTTDELKLLRGYSESIVLKTAESEVRLLDESMLFLHRIHKNLNEEQQQLLSKLLQEDTKFLDKKVLIVDDDFRNLFALSAVLEEYGLKTIIAGDGQESLVKLEEYDDIDIVLMDIMMPIMNGYEAIEKIRKGDEKIKDIPIIALTAKAQKEDRQKCLDSGANDYMSKPIDNKQLLHLIKVLIS
jgi:signal transduction histidine kinase/DNA-binding response OmpR family regulator